MDECAEYVMKLILKESRRAEIEYQRKLQGNEFADAVQRKVMAAWKRGKK